jgi:PST family polysaccharide transporter
MRPSLRALSLRWIAWAALTRFGRDGVHLAGRLVLARLLWPEAFGLFALAYAVAVGLQVLCLLQLEPALVQRPALSAGARATAHWSMTAGAVAGAAVLVLLAGPLGALLGAPAVAPVARAMGAWLVLTALGAAARATLLRDLAFRRLALAALAAEVVGTGAAIGAALAGAGVWSLVVHVLLTELVETSLVWAMASWRPALHWRRDEFADLMRFGGPLLGRRGVDYLIGQGDRLLLGYTAGPAALGLYALALRLSRSVTEPVGAIFGRVAFPAFAHAREDLGRTRRGFFEALRAQAAVTIPLVTALAMTARDLVPLLLGGAWEGAVVLMQVLCVRAVAASLNTLPRAALLGRGRQWLVLALALASLAAYAAGWLIGLSWGALGVAAGGAAAALAGIPAGIALLRLEMPVSPRLWARALWPGASGAAALAAAMAVAERAVAPLLEAGPRGRLALMLAAGGAAALGAMAPFLVGELRRHRGTGPAAPAEAGASTGPASR